MEKMISLFSGAGGLDLGLSRSGFELAIGVESAKDCRETLAANGLKNLSSSLRVEDVYWETLLTEANLDVGETALLAGGPPCQPFSKSGKWVTGATRGLQDPRANTLIHFLTLAESLLPRVILLENVKGIANKADSAAVNFIEDALVKINREAGTDYRPVSFIINAADYGVPQLRERFFLVAHRDGFEFELPQATHFRPDDSDLFDQNSFACCWDAIGGMQVPEGEAEAVKPKGKWADLLSSIPEGKNYLWHTEKGGGEPLFGWRTRYWSFLLKLSKGLPSWTIQASPGPATGPFHWDNRRLSSAEMAAIQTFPSDYQFAGDFNSRRQQIGNAVPPALGFMLGEALRKQFFGAACEKKANPFLPPARADLPSSAKTSKVPRKYRAEGPAPRSHPGPGKGPRALLREQGA